MTCDEIIDALIARRQESGLTQKDLAERVHLAQSAIARFESKRVSPGYDMVEKIAGALDCKIVIERKPDERKD